MLKHDLIYTQHLQGCAPIVPIFTNPFPYLQYNITSVIDEIIQFSTLSALVLLQSEIQRFEVVWQGI